MLFLSILKVLSSIPDQLSFIYHGIIFGAVVLLVYLLWQYWKFTKVYEDFPTYPFILSYLYSRLLGKLPPNLPFTSYVFQKVVHVAKRFQDEGMFLVWVPHPSLFIFSEEAVKIFSNEKSAINKPSAYSILKEVFGNSILTSDAETWKMHRKLLNPAFQVGELKRSMSLFNENAQNLVKKLEEVTNKSPIDVLEYLKVYAGAIICEYIMGLQFDEPEKKFATEEVFHAVEIIGELLVERLSQPWLHFKCIYNLVPSGRKFANVIESCFKFVKKIILETKESTDFIQICKNKDDLSHDGMKANSLVQTLLEFQLQDPNITMKYIQDEVATVIAGGYDTVSYTLMWCLFLLGHHPDVQEQAFEEVNSMSDGFILHEDLHRLKYLESTIKETLRLYSPIPIYARHIEKDVQCGKYNVPRGTNIVFFPYMLHRDPKIYPDPDKYDPSRYLESKLKNHPWAYTPFAEGIRSCIGKRFAMMEMKVLLAHIVRHFRIQSVTPREEVDLKWAIVLAPKKPLLIKLIPRN